MIEGRTPLHYAADYGQNEVVRYLLEKGANANVSFDFHFLQRNLGVFASLMTDRYFQATDKHGITTLLAAIWEGHTNCVKLLLEKGANPDGLTPDGMSYIDAAEKDEIKVLLRPLH